jgi:hypothetical protein
VSTGQINTGMEGDKAAFETRDFYLACFLRCTGYDLIDLRAESSRLSSIPAFRRPNARWRRWKGGFNRSTQHPSLLI